MKHPYSKILGIMFGFLALGYILATAVIYGLLFTSWHPAWVLNNTFFLLTFSGLVGGVWWSIQKIVVPLRIEFWEKVQEDEKKNG